jgi:putative Mn2+ efflux pump MntP
MIDFIIEFTYDGTILSLGKLGINIYFDQMLVGVVEICASIFACYIITRVERKRYCKISFLLVSLFTTILGILSLIETH